MLSITYILCEPIIYIKLNVVELECGGCRIRIVKRIREYLLQYILEWPQSFLYKTFTFRAQKRN